MSSTLMPVKSYASQFAKWHQSVVSRAMNKENPISKSFMNSVSNKAIYNVFRRTFY